MSTPGARTLSVVTVTYNSEALVSEALRSAQAAAATVRLATELIVIDNASADATCVVVTRDFPAARVLANEENIGFARANNQAFAMAGGDLWLLLNPDARLDAQGLRPLVEFLERNPAVAAVAPSIRTNSGRGPEFAGMSPSLLSMLGHYFLLNRLLWSDRGGPWRGTMLQRRPRLGPRPVDWLGAAVLLLRPEAIRSIGGFDPRFFLYGEDVDLGERLRGAGWELWLVPEARASHLIAGSQGRVSTRWVDASHAHYSRRGGPRQVLAHDLVLALALTPRAVLSTVCDRSPEGRIHAAMLRASARQAWGYSCRTLRSVRVFVGDPPRDAPMPMSPPDPPG